MNCVRQFLLLTLLALAATTANAYGVGDTIYMRDAKYKVTAANLVTNGELKGASLDGWTATDATVAGLSDVFAVLEDGGVSVNAGMNSLLNGMYQVVNVSEGGTYVVTMEVRGAEPGHTEVNLSAPGSNYIFAYFNTDGTLAYADGATIVYGEGGKAIENCYSFTDEDFTEFAFPVKAATNGKVVIDFRGLAAGIEIRNVECHKVQAVGPVVVASAVSSALLLDTREGPFESDGAETLTYSGLWDGNSNSVVTIAQACDTPCTTNGALVSGLNGEGEWSWTAQYDGTYTLTHVTIADGVTGKVETATFVVSGLGLPPTAGLTAEIAWKLLEATGTYFAQLKVTCTNGLATGVSDLKFMFADRIGADGKNEAALWSSLSRSVNANTTTVGGKTYRFVALDSALITAENTPAAYGVSDMSASSIPVNERTIEMYVRRRVNPQAGNERAANVDNFVGYVVWSSGGENLSLPVAAGAVGRALGAAGLSTASNTATLPSPKRLNTALAVGVMPEEDGEPYCKFSEFSVDGDTIRGKIEVGADGQAGRVGQNARLVLLGGDSPGGALADLCTVDVGSDGSFTVPAPKDARFFKLALEIEEVAE